MSDPFNLTPPKLPSLKQVVSITTKNIDDRHKRDVEARLVEEFYEEHKVEIITSEILEHLVWRIERAAGLGQVELSYEHAARSHRLTGAQGCAVAASLREALRDYNPDILYLNPDPALVAQWYRAANERGNEFAYAAADYHTFHGWRIHLNWREPVEAKLRG